MSIYNIFTVTKGYHRNNSANKENDKILLETSNKIKNDEDISMIELNKLPNLNYSSDQPYMGNRDYILMWIREYYDLPEDIEIIYKEKRGVK